ncbi:hypothetical protein M1O20_05855 [Dehalococcoidia bacterium]|nr:hypothetical protein [Dehalococcoidia bacterium]
MALVLIAGPLAAIAQGLPAGASIVDLEPVPPPEREVDVARRAGQAWVDKIAVIDSELSEWQGARLTAPKPFHNPKGEVIAYMFAIEREGNIIGRVFVGSAAYGYSIFEGSQAPPICIPPRAEVSRILREAHGLQIAEETLGQPKLLLLNILRGFYAVWQVQGQVVGMNLVTGDSFVVPRLQDIRTLISSPEVYMAAKRAVSQSMQSPAKQETVAGAMG